MKLTLSWLNTIVTLFAKKKPSENELAIEKASQNKIPRPELYLGENYSGGKVKLIWHHEDDLFVDFYLMPGFSVDNAELFMRYVAGTMTAEDKEKYPYHFHECFIEADHFEKQTAGYDVMATSDREEQFALLVMYQNCLGMLLLTPGDHIHRLLNIAGIETKETKEYYHLQFMRFDAALLKELGVQNDVLSWFNYAHHKNQPNVRVNFARFTEIEGTS